MKTLLLLSALALTASACGGRSDENTVRDGGHGIGIDTETVNSILEPADTLDAQL